MSEYHKIQSVYLRDPATKHKTFLEGQYSLPEFQYLETNLWEATEKVDGTNIRIYWDAETRKVTISGRTKDAQLPTFLYDKLLTLFPSLPYDHSIALYGEGFGSKIQKGGGDYIPDGCGFILFDVWCGKWLSRSCVLEVAGKLAIPIVPIVGYMTLLEAIELCKAGFESKLRKTPPEGLVLRPLVDLFTSRRERVITKIKLRDFNTRLVSQ